VFIFSAWVDFFTIRGVLDGNVEIEGAGDRGGGSCSESGPAGAAVVCHCYGGLRIA
jgi:hypothetical protein